VRYCDPAPASSLLWSGPDGAITRAELEAHLGYLAQAPPEFSNNNDNQLANKQLGSTLVAAANLFEATGDIRALDMAFQIADK
jgi:hypothetical protein